MAKKVNNTVLLGLLALLALIFFLTNYFRGQQRQGNFRAELFTLDTAKVERLVLEPSSGQSETLTFTRQGGGWQVSNEEVTAAAAQNVVPQLLGQLQQLEPEQLVAKSEDQWGQYELEPGQATRVRITANGADQPYELLVGKLELQQPTPAQQRQMQQMGRRPQPQGKTYVRLGNETEVYAVQGMLAPILNRGFSAWRDATFLSLQKNNLTRLQFQTPEGGYTLARPDSVWRLDGRPADSVAVEQYLSQLSQLQNRNFADDFTPSGEPSHRLTIQGNNMAEVTVEAYPVSGSENSYMLHSSMNRGVYFQTEEENGLLGRVFKQPEEWSSEGE